MPTHMLGSMILRFQALHCAPVHPEREEVLRDRGRQDDGGGLQRRHEQRHQRQRHHAEAEEAALRDAEQADADDGDGHEHEVVEQFHGARPLNVMAGLAPAIHVLLQV